jgi:anti-sigma regulatory factor (Ser/Thr protein kinase)
MSEAAPRPWPSADGHRLVLAAEFDARTLSETRHQVSHAAGQCGMPRAQLDDFAIAVNELMTNAVRHGGGCGQLRLWCDADLLCEIADDGHGFPATAYLQRTSPPVPSPLGGMGLWLAQQVTAELAIRSGTAGTTIRLRAPLSGRSDGRHNAPDLRGHIPDRQRPSGDNARID